MDGIITDATFIVHKKPAQSRVMVLEFYGRSMHQAAVVIGQIVDLRNRIREEGDYARLSALEEFNAKYVRAIEYQKKSDKHDGVPFPSSSFRWTATSRTCWKSAFRKSWISWPRTTTWRSSWRRMRRKPNFSGKIATVFPPSPAGRPDSRSTRTWSFPMQRIPDFALFLEQLQSGMLGYRIPPGVAGAGASARHGAGGQGSQPRIRQCDPRGAGRVPSSELSDEEMEERAVDSSGSWPSAMTALPPRSKKSATICLVGRVVVASHMHAGDGNCHVNIPVNSNDLHMLEIAEEAAMRSWPRRRKWRGRFR